MAVDFIKYDSSFVYSTIESIDVNLGDVSNIGFATNSQSLNIISPINKQNITFSPYINSQIVDYKASEDIYSTQVYLRWFGDGEDMYVETDFEIAGSIASTDQNYIKTWTNLGEAYFTELVGVGYNQGNNDKYLRISESQLITTKSFTWIGKTPKLVGIQTDYSLSTDILYYLKIEMDGYTRTNIDSQSKPEKDIHKTELRIQVGVDGLYYTDSGVKSSGYLTCVFVDETKNTNAKDDNYGNYEQRVLSDKWVSLKGDRKSQKSEPHPVYVPLFGFTGNDLEFGIYGYKSFKLKRNGTYEEVTSDTYDLRLKNIKITVVDGAAVEVENEDINYDSYINKLVKNDGENITFELGTNVDLVPCSKGAIMKYEGGKYDFVQNFTRQGTIDILENLLCKSYKSNYLNRTIEIQCTTNGLDSIFGYLTYSNYWTGINFGIEGAVINYSDNTVELTLQQVIIDDPSLEIEKNYD